MESNILISSRGARSWEARNTPGEMRNQAEDSFLLNHLEQNAPAAYSRPRNKLKRAASCGLCSEGREKGTELLGLFLAAP